MKTLLFETDEGIGDSEVLSVGKRDGGGGQVFAMLENIHAGLAPLTERFRVAVQIYPNCTTGRPATAGTRAGREQLYLAQPGGSGGVLRFFDAATGRQTGRELELEFTPSPATCSPAVRAFRPRPSARSFATSTTR